MGSTVTSFSESVDIAPTILDWVGEETYVGFNGRSLMPFLNGKTPDNWRSHIFSEFDFGDPIEPSRFQEALQLGPAEANCAVLRDDNFKYVHFNGGLEPLLYDMKADPNEGDNLASDPTHLPVLLKFVQRMINHRMTFAHHATSRMKLTENGVRIG